MSTFPSPTVAQGENNVLADDTFSQRLYIHLQKYTLLFCINNTRQ